MDCFAEPVITVRAQLRNAWALNSQCGCGCAQSRNGTLLRAEYPCAVRFV